VIDHTYKIAENTMECTGLHYKFRSHNPIARTFSSWKGLCNLNL